MTKRIFYSLLLTALTLNLFFGARQYFRSAGLSPENDPRRNLRVFITVLEEVLDEYVDGEDLTYQDLIRGALDGLMAKLDPYSEYMPPQKYETLQSDTEGSFGGVGVSITVRGGVLTVVEPMEGTPAFEAGVLPNDRIVQIDGQSTEGFQLEDAVKLLRGKPGDGVRLTLSRPSTGETIDVDLKRADIKVPKVKDINGRGEFPLGPDKIGYIRLTQFDEQTSRDLENALDALEAQGMEALILDVRDNPGGLLDQAVRVCDKFLPKGELIVSTEGRDPADAEKFYASGRDKRLDVPMAVLTNGASASASEIVAGCLQDLGRAIVVGERTFGKGSVQKIRPLEDGAALRLSTAKYYTPSHKVIHGQGIAPDIEAPLSEEDKQALFLKRLPGGTERLEQVLQSMPEETRAAISGRLETVRDHPLDRAVDLLRALRIYSQRQG